MKKKLLTLSLVLGLGLLTVAGCSQSSTTPANPSIPASTIATDVGNLAKMSLAIDNNVLGVIGLGVSGADVSAAAPSTPVYNADGDGYWKSTDSWTTGGGLTNDYTYKFRVWNSVPAEVTTDTALNALSGLADLNKIWIWTSFTGTYTGGSYSISYGTGAATPLKFEGATASGFSIIDGPITFSSTYSGDSYSITLNYTSLNLTGGYPSGTINFSVSESGAVVVGGSIIYDGTNIALLTFTSGYSGSYSVNLDTGAVTAAAVN